MLLTATGQAGAACGDEPRLHALDFWLGRWDVTASGEPSGSNEIDAILDGAPSPSIGSTRRETPD